jgi:hypothetical protein
MSQLFHWDEGRLLDGAQASQSSLASQSPSTTVRPVFEPGPLAQCVVVGPSGARGVGAMHPMHDLLYPTRGVGATRVADPVTEGSTALTLETFETNDVSDGGQVVPHRLELGLPSVGFCAEAWAKGHDTVSIYYEQGCDHAPQLVAIDGGEDANDDDAPAEHESLRQAKRQRLQT